jgi:hypothetical protein
MNKNRTFLPLLICLSTAQLAPAALIDFEDLSLTIYNVGNSFNSGGIPFNVVAYNGAGGAITVATGGTPANKLIRMNNSVGVNLSLPSGVASIAFDYTDQCTGCTQTGITVNGSASSPLVELVNLNGTMLGGAAITVGSPSAAAFQKRLTVTGPISTFTVGGTELSLDNLAVTIPEPATLFLAATGFVFLITNSGRHRVPLLACPAVPY